MKENEDKVLATYLLDLIKKEIKNEIKKASFMNSYSGVVTAVGTGVASVKLGGSDVVLANLKNRTNLTLNINDEVVVVVLKGNLSNCFIAWKK